jgi:hypothetical protein
VTPRPLGGTVARMFVRAASVAASAPLVLALVAVSAHADVPREVGLRGRVVVAAELKAAKDWPVDGERAKALRTAANVRRARGRPLRPVREPLPALSVVVEGEDVRTAPSPERRLVLEGLRFAPGQALLPRGGPLILENRHDVPLTVVGTRNVDGRSETAVLATLAPGATETVNLADGVHDLTLKEMPFAKATVRVLKQGRLLPVGDDGMIPLVDLASGDYSLAFFLGAAELRREPMTIAPNGLVFIDATISANTVVDVTQRDATLQIAVPVASP